MKPHTISQKCFGALIIGMLLLSGAGAKAAPPLEELLMQTGRSVELFWQDAASFASTEAVTQEKIGKKGKREFRSETTYDYMAITKSDDEGLTIEELRIPQKRGSSKSNPPSLLSTNGFPSLLLVFHPRHQTNYRYRVAADNSPDAQLLAVHFEQVPGMKSTCALVLQERIYSLALHGTAWIDKETGIIQKIQANLISPMEDINIKAFKVEVSYKPQRFSPGSDSKWLPSDAVIDIETALQHWRNTHRYTHYKRFTVELSEASLR